MGRQAQTGFTARLQPGEGLQNPQAPGPVFPHPRTEQLSSPPLMACTREMKRAKRKEQNGLASAGSKGVKG